MGLIWLQLRPSQERCAFVAVSRTKVVSTHGKVTERKTLSRLSRDIQPLSLFGCHRGLTRNPGMSFTECTFVYGYPVHSNLLVVRCSDVWTIAHASSSAEGFLIGPVRLPEFFRGCGGANQRQCGQNLRLQGYEIRAPRPVCSSLSDCFHVPLLNVFPWACDPVGDCSLKYGESRKPNSKARNILPWHELAAAVSP